jgi:hypothetical protein
MLVSLLNTNLAYMNVINVCHVLDFCHIMVQLSWPSAGGLSLWACTVSPSFLLPSPFSPSFWIVGQLSAHPV